ncbi:unnamed protein product [Caenorhabditis nigoni]
MTEREFTIKYEFQDLSELKYKKILSSPEEEHIGLKWKIGIEHRGSLLAVFLYNSSMTRNQGIDVIYTTKIFSRKKEIHSECGDKEFEGYLIWCGHIANVYGELVVEIRVKIMKMIGFPRIELRSFGEEMKQFSDVILKVEDRKFYVSKLYLASQSPYFATLFLGQFQESEKSEIELKDVNSDEFQCFLELIYAENVIDDDTVEELLHIADIYDTPLVVKKCEKYLIKESKMESENKLELAEEYKLEELRKLCLESQ